MVQCALSKCVCMCMRAHEKWKGARYIYKGASSRSQFKNEIVTLRHSLDRECPKDNLLCSGNLLIVIEEEVPGSTHIHQILHRYIYGHSSDTSHFLLSGSKGNIIIKLFVRICNCTVSLAFMEFTLNL